MVDEATGIRALVTELLENPDQRPSQRPRETNRDKLLSEIKGYDPSKLCFYIGLPSEFYFG
jgi:hypothetical protein